MISKTKARLAVLIAIAIGLSITSAAEATEAPTMHVYISFEAGGIFLIEPIEITAPIGSNLEYLTRTALELQRCQYTTSNAESGFQLNSVESYSQSALENGGDPGSKWSALVYQPLPSLNDQLSEGDEIRWRFSELQSNIEETNKTGLIRSIAKAPLGTEARASAMIALLDNNASAESVTIALDNLRWAPSPLTNGNIGLDKEDEGDQPFLESDQNGQEAETIDENFLLGEGDGAASLEEAGDGEAKGPLDWAPDEKAGSPLDTPANEEGVYLGEAESEEERPYLGESDDEERPYLGDTDEEDTFPLEDPIYLEDLGEKEEPNNSEIQTEKAASSDGTAETPIGKAENAKADERPYLEASEEEPTAKADLKASDSPVITPTSAEANDAASNEPKGLGIASRYGAESSVKPDPLSLSVTMRFKGTGDNLFDKSLIVYSVVSKDNSGLGLSSGLGELISVPDLKTSENGKSYILITDKGIEEAGYIGNYSLTNSKNKELKIGDVNGDNKIDILDALEILDIWSMKGAPAKNELSIIADVNGDGVIDASDALAIVELFTNSK